jgi:dTDP-4-amino-4,6-dideoxygalactose transaminase
VDRDKVVRELEEAKVGTRLVFAGNLTKQPAYKNVNFRISGDLKVTDRILESAFWIGVHPALDDEKISYMLEQLEAVLKK